MRLAITGGESGLLLGRPLFLFISRLVLNAGVEPAHAEIVLRWFWTAVGATAAPLFAALAVRLGADRRVAFIAGLTLALSPSFAHTAHQVLTDAPALALSIVALWSAAKRQAVAAGLVLAAAVATRETALVHLVAVAWLCGRRWWLPVIVCLASIALVVVISSPPAMGTWTRAMSLSARANPLSAADVALAFVWVLAAGPLAVIAGGRALVLRAVPEGVRKIAWPSVVATIALLFYPDGSFSPRYMLATVPTAFFIPAAFRLRDRRGLIAAGLAVPLILALVAAHQANRVADYGATVASRVSALPVNAFVVPGHFCPQARLAATVHDRADLTFICPGWEWPMDVESLLSNAVANGVIVAVDVSPEAWVGKREQPLRARLREWVAGRETRDVAGFAVVSR